MQMSRAVISSLEVFVTFVVQFLAAVVVAVSEVIVAYASVMARFMPVFVYNPQSHFGSTSSAKQLRHLATTQSSLAGQHDPKQSLKQLHLYWMNLTDQAERQWTIDLKQRPCLMMAWQETVVHLNAYEPTVVRKIRRNDVPFPTARKHHKKIYFLLHTNITRKFTAVCLASASNTVYLLRFNKCSLTTHVFCVDSI